MIDDFMAWNRSLSLADIQNVYAAGRLGGFGVKSFGHLTMAPDTTLDLANAAGVSGAGAAAFDSIRTAGNATIKGDVTNRGIVAPGASPGTLTITGNFAMDTGSTYQWETAGTAPGQSDLIAVSGNLDLSKNWTLAATPRAAVPSGTYNVMTYGGALTPGGTATVARGASAYADLVNVAGSSVTSGGGNVALNLAMNPLTEWNSAGTDWDQPLVRRAQNAQDGARRMRNLGWGPRSLMAMGMGVASIRGSGRTNTASCCEGFSARATYGDDGRRKPSNDPLTEGPRSLV
jgi:hypothetical protein